MANDIREALSLSRQSLDWAPVRPSELSWLRPYITGRLWRIGTAAACLALAALCGAAVPILLMAIIDSLLPAKSGRAFTGAVLALLGLHVVRPICSFLAGYHLAVLGQSVQAAVRADLFGRLVRLPVTFLEKRHTGYLVARLGEVRSLSVLFSQAMLAPVLITLECTVSLAAMLYVNWQIALSAVAAVPVVYGLARVQSRSVRFSTRSLMEQGAVASQRMQESLSGVQTIKEHGTEDREAGRIAASLHELGHAGVIQSVAHTLASESVMIAMAAAGVFMLWLSGRAIMASTFTVGGYVAFTAYFVKFLAPAQVLMSLGMALQQSSVGLRRLSELRQQATEDESAARVEVLSGGDRAGHIRCEDVHFRYDGAASEALSGITAEILPGECVAIVGASGSGKSTLVRLILGLYPVTSGRIWLDGHDVQRVRLRSLRDRIAVVSQTAFLFNDTVRNNILYSQPSASEPEVVAAAMAADAHGFIADLPRGYDTVIGERGALLSGGQRQRVSIARALLRNPDVVIFDEATSELDGDSERRVWREAERRCGTKTRIVISHRSVPVLRADRVIVLAAGRVVASGRPEEVLANRPANRDLLADAAVRI